MKRILNTYRTRLSWKETCSRRANLTSVGLNLKLSGQSISKTQWKVNTRKSVESKELPSAPSTVLERSHDVYIAALFKETSASSCVVIPLSPWQVNRILND